MYLVPRLTNEQLDSQEVVAQLTGDVTNYLLWARHLSGLFSSDLS